jgi:gentisate 1,2-dioxygenase
LLLDRDRLPEYSRLTLQSCERKGAGGMEQAPIETPERKAFYARIDKQNMTPLWSVINALITPEPRSACVPAVWRFDEIRTAMLEAGALITANEAERRVLILENPGMRGQSKITTSLYAGVQLVMPHEVAPAHRHSQSALRFVLEGKGAHTSVDGERTMMSPGDFIITPFMAWHDHGNDTDEPMFWLDGLDIPIIQLLDASFIERYEEEVQPIGKPVGDSSARYGANLLPIDYSGSSVTSPIFNYPYERTREALHRLSLANDCDPCHGIKMRYTNPVNGDHAMPTIGTYIQLLPKVFKTSRYRSTDATVFVAMEGHGQTRVGEERLQWGPKDIFVVPSWKPIVHEALEGECVLFSFSDRPLQEKIGVWREDRGNA